LEEKSTLAIEIRTVDRQTQHSPKPMPGETAIFASFRRSFENSSEPHSP